MNIFSRPLKCANIGREQLLPYGSFMMNNGMDTRNITDDSIHEYMVCRNNLLFNHLQLLENNNIHNNIKTNIALLYLEEGLHLDNAPSKYAQNLLHGGLYNEWNNMFSQPNTFSSE